MNNSFLNNKLELRINETTKVTWRRKKSKIICTISIGEDTYNGMSVKKKGDVFEMVYGMRKGIESAIRNNSKQINKKVRKDIHDAVKKAYGAGRCEQKRELEKMEIGANIVYYTPRGIFYNNTPAQLNQ